VTSERGLGARAKTVIYHALAVTAKLSLVLLYVTDSKFYCDSAV